MPIKVPNSLPNAILYATSARIGGSGLDAVALETIRAAMSRSLLGRAIAFDDRKCDIPGVPVRSLRWHPVRLLSWIGSKYYYGAKKHALDRVAAAELLRGRYDLFHGWSGECVRSLRAARKRGIPGVIEIPTWHRHKGRPKSHAPTRSEREAAKLSGWRGFLNNQLVTRQQQLEEYDLADLILVLSAKAEETFLAAGISPSKLFRHSRGVDPERFSPGRPPEKFTALFVGALIERKGVPLLLETWHRLALPEAELVLAGAPHPETAAALKRFASPSVRVLGFVSAIQEVYRNASVHVFPSSCEGSAKSTYEAAACGLPQIATSESGDVVVDGENGIVIPTENPDALAEAILKLYRDPDLRARMGAVGRKRILENFTWDHFAARLENAWRTAKGRVS